MSEALVEFIKDSYKAGKTPEEIRSVLRETGWTEKQISDALRRFVYGVFPVAIPKPIVIAIPRLEFLNVFFFFVLYILIFNVIWMLFALLDIHLPYGEGSSSFQLKHEILWNLAMILACVPFVWLSSRFIRKAMEETKQRICKIRLRLIYTTMFIFACFMLQNVAFFTNSILSGKPALGFIMKAFILFATTVALFTFFRVEMKEAERET